MPVDDDGEIVMEGVASSMIAAVGHDPENDTLRVEFNTGATWEYDDVPESTYSSLIGSASVGVYFNRHIKDSYTGRKV